MISIHELQTLADLLRGRLFAWSQAARFNQGPMECWLLGIAHWVASDMVRIIVTSSVITIGSWSIFIFYTSPLKWTFVAWVYQPTRQHTYIYIYIHISPKTSSAVVLILVGGYTSLKKSQRTNHLKYCRGKMIKTAKQLYLSNALAIRGPM